MKKLIALLSVAVLAISANAEFKGGLNLRSRAELSNLNSYNADKQAMSRYTQIRVQPWFSYNVNEFLSAKVIFEIGDITYGVKGENPGKSSGGGIGTDGVNAETKHAYLDITPNKTNNIRLGLQAYNDPNSLILDDDLAGIKYDGTFDALSLGLGWFVTIDDGEKNIDKTTYSYGTTGITADLGYKIDDKMSAGLCNVIKMDKNAQTGVGTGDINLNSTKMWISPYFSGDFGMVTADLQFVYNMRSAEYEAVGDSATINPTAKKALEDGIENGSGMVLSLKTNIKPSDALNIGVNFLYVGSDKKGVDVYRGWDYMDDGEMYQDTWYMNGCQILAPGINDKGNKNLFGKVGAPGLMMPALTVGYKVSDMISIGGNFGMAMTLEDVSYLDKNGVSKKDTNLGMEFGLNSSITLLEKLNLTPYAAFFMPGNAGSKLLGGNGIDTDMQMKIGTVLSVKF